MKFSLFQGILFGVFGLFALIGLFVFATYSGKGGASDIGTVVVWGTLPAEDMRAALSAAALGDQSLKGVSYVEKDPATLPGDLAAAIATGGAPDLVLASQEELAPMAKFLAPIPFSTLSARAFSATFVEEGNLLAAPGGGYLGVPFLVDPLVLFSNSAILSSSAVATPPSTWEAFTGLAPSLTLLSSSRRIERGMVALGTYANVHDARGILSALFLQAGAPVSARVGSGLIAADLGHTSSLGIAPGEAVLRFYTQFADPSKISYSWDASLPDSQAAFLAGNLALYLGFASEARFMRQANPNLDFSVAPVPQPATATAKTTYGLLYSFMIPRGAKNASGAYRVAALLSGDAAQAAAARATGLASASRSVLANPPADDPIAAVAYASALYAKGWLSPAPADTDAVFSRMIDDTRTGRAPLPAALAGAESSLTALLQP